MAARTAFQIEPTQIDLRAAEQAVAFLAALRIDLDRDGLAETPGRTARAYAERFYTQPFQMTSLSWPVPWSGVVLLEAEHSCMSLCGAEAVGAHAVTSALLGTLRHDPSSRAEFFSLSGVSQR